MNQINRRRFLKTGIAGAGIVAIPQVMASAASLSQEQKIVSRTLGKTGLQVPVISFGVMRSDNAALCRAAYDNGIKLFDTANGYQGGNNEVMLGNLFKGMKRDTFFLATKVKAAQDRDGKPTSESTADKFLEMFNTSLSRLQMDYVDILYMHDVSNAELLTYKPLINAIKGIKKSGKARFIGFSTHRNEPLMINTALESDTWDVILTQYNYKLAYAEELTAAIKKAAAAGIGIIAMKTLAGGGFLDRERTKPMNTTAAIKWVLSNPGVTTTIPGMTSFDQLELNSKILADVTLTDNEKSDLLAASYEEGLMCTGCGNCSAECPHKVPVRDIMRAYMYSYGYGMPSMAKSLLGELGISKDPCGDCSRCMVNCSRNFNLKSKIADITRLVNIPGEFLA